ncbi:MAG TPA: hypothetical protein DCX95_02205 [Elusimicrobia bacterium]|nr:hypothetical protein [Elusimicrobiota bacterium]
MKKISVLLFMILCSSIAGTESKNFAAGCDFYKKAEYEKALEMFKSAEREYPTANLYYNIANSYYRLGKTGYSLLYYERARRLSPSDGDINFNIKFLSGIINDPDYEQGFFAKIGEDIAKLFFSIALLFLSAVISVKFLNPGKTLFWPFIISFIFVVLFSSLYIVKYRQQKEISAVVLKSESEVRSGPDYSFKVSFTLPEGKKIRVLNESGAWAEVGVKSMGLRGWVESKNIGII